MKLTGCDQLLVDSLLHSIQYFVSTHKDVASRMTEIIVAVALSDKDLKFDASSKLKGNYTRQTHVVLAESGNNSSQRGNKIALVAIPPLISASTPNLTKAYVYVVNENMFALTTTEFSPSVIV